MATPANHGLAMMAAGPRCDVGMLRNSQFDSPTAVLAIAPTPEVIAGALGRNASQPLARWELPGPVGSDRVTTIWKMAGMGV